MWKILFFGSLATVLYAYFGYPVSLKVVSGLGQGRAVRKKSLYPTVTLIITAFNEEKRLTEKLESTLKSDYPNEKLQILVASDGSVDRTNDIVRGFRERGVELLALPERGGKERAQAAAVRKATGEILLFTDVATILPPESLREIVSNFADPSVGCVSSEDKMIGKDGRPSGEGFYVRYEMWLRRLESKVGSLVGLSGSFFAARREVCRDFSGEMQSDFRTVLNSVKLGLRGVSDPCAIGYYQDLADEGREFDRKVRTVLRGLTVFFRHLEFLNVFRYGMFSYQIFCHKLLRWVVPFFLLLAFVSNLALMGKSPAFVFLLLGQVLFYGMGLMGWKFGTSRFGVVTRISSYFLAVNASIALAWWRYLKGQRVVMWTPSER